MIHSLQYGNDQKFPTEATFKKWKEKFPWLKILSNRQQKKMICEICTNQEEKLKQMPHMNLMFVNFIAILCDRTSDASITEQEVVYVFFL